MSGTIKVKPADGVYVSQPDRSGLPIPPEGAIVADNSFYRRAILTGDLVEIREAEPEQGAAEPAPPSDEAAQDEKSAAPADAAPADPATPESPEAAADAPKGRRRPASNLEQE